MSERDQDFLGWAPAEPLEWEPEASSWEPRRAAPVAPQAPHAPQPASAEPVVSRPVSGRTPQPGQHTTAPRPQTYRAPQPPPPARPRVAGRLLGITAIAAGFMLAFTVSALLNVLFGGSAPGPVPFFTGIATLMLARAAWAMRPRKGAG